MFSPSQPVKQRKIMDTIAKLRDVLLRLEEIMKCAICLDTLKTDVVPCMSGHGICSSCRRQLLTCPTCGEFFLFNKPTMLLQVMEILPKLCQYTQQGCKEISFSGSHERYCIYRPIKCNIGHPSECLWVGEAKNFKSHVQSRHNSSFTSYSIGTERKLFHKHFKGNWMTQQYLHVLDDNIFVVFAHKDRLKKTFIQGVKHVPLGQPNSNHYFVVTLSKKDIVFKHTIKATPLINENERLEKSPYCMVVPLEEVKTFLDGHGHLEVTFEVIKKRLSLG